MHGKYLKEARERKGFSQEELSWRLGITRSKLSLVETDKRQLKLSELEDAARILDVSIYELLTGVTEENRGITLEKLGMSGKVAEALKQMPQRQRELLEVLITDDFFPRCLELYVDSNTKGHRATVIVASADGTEKHINETISAASVLELHLLYNLRRMFGGDNNEEIEL